MVDFNNHNSVDLSLEIDLTERVIVKQTGTRLDITHAGEIPPHPRLRRPLVAALQRHHPAGRVAGTSHPTRIAQHHARRPHRARNMGQHPPGQARPRRKLTNQVAQGLLRAQQLRIKAQQTPESTPYTPRKPRKALRSKKERIKKQKAAMFAKLRTNSHLKTKADGNGITVGFFGRVARIARVHQSGLPDRVAKDGPEVTYAERGLIGFNQTDKVAIQESILSLIRS